MFDEACLRIRELRLVPQDGVLKYNGVKDVDGFDPKLEGHTQATFATYQLKFTTTPGDAKYEVRSGLQMRMTEAYVESGWQFEMISRRSPKGVTNARNDRRLLRIRTLNVGPLLVG